MRRARWLVHRGALQVYRRLPKGARRAVVRLVAPTYSVGALAVIERHDGAILLIRQVYRHNWGLPGGLVGRLEDPARAAVREVAEEVGLRVELTGRGALVADVEPRRFDFVYPARVAGPDPAGAAAAARPTSPELRAVGWFHRDQLPDLQFETKIALRALEEPDAFPYVVGGRAASGSAGAPTS